MTLSEPTRNLALEIVRVTEAAALGIWPLDGTGRKRKGRPGSGRSDAPHSPFGFYGWRDRDR